MTGACVNFEPVSSALQAVAHASRAVAPSYLLAPAFSLGTIVIIDDKNAVAITLERKLEMASRQAKREKNFSPLWEGVINLERPVIDSNFDAVEYKKRCVDSIRKWTVDYEKLTGHKVLRSDIHLDEGMVEDGEVKLNAHAHVIVDRTNEKGRVIKLSRTELQQVQTLTAKATGLPRGESATGGRKHLDHQTYKLLQEQAKAKANEKVAEVQSELEKLKVEYAADRAALKASGTALQSDYQKLKERYEAFKVKAHEAVDKGNVIIKNLDEENRAMKKELVDVRAQAAAELVELTGMRLAEAKQKVDAAAQRLEAKPTPQPDTQEAVEAAQEAFLKKHHRLPPASKSGVLYGTVVESCGNAALLHTGGGVYQLHVFNDQRELELSIERSKGKGQGQERG